MKKAYPFTRDLVLIGGGHTHALVLRSWAMKPLPGVRLTVINPGPTAPYSGMLPGFVAGHYTRDELDIDLIRLARFAGARIIVGAVDHIDVAAKTVSVPGRPLIHYDVTAVDVGITSVMPQLPGFTEHAVPAKPLGAFAAKWDAFRKKAHNPEIAIIGGGVAGAELSMAMAHALRKAGSDQANVQLVDRSRALQDLGPTAQQLVRSALESQGVSLIEDANVVAVTDQGLSLADGTLVRSDFTTGAAGAKPHDWVSDTDVTLHDGFIAVSETLQSSDPDLFAVGDCAHLTFDPRPKAGVYAVREAPVLFDNLRARLSGENLRPYKPQRDYLKLVSLGDKVAMAEKFGTARKGRLLWKLKDHIDRKFMNQFVDLPAMSEPDVPRTAAYGLKDLLGAQPLCGGCGSKVGQATLQNALANHTTTTRDDVLSQPGDDAAIIRTGGATQVITTDHLRSFVPDAGLMSRIAAVHALGDIAAMGANPQVATANLILPRMTAKLQERTLGEIMKCAAEVFYTAGASIVGGHTSQGDELTIGFTVTGLCERAPIRLEGAHVGDAIILTKPIGSGVILAAEMQMKAQGADVVAAYDVMSQSPLEAATILREAHAMTDVTGFGLAGHLAGLCKASGVGAEVTMRSVPLMPGALALAEQGIRSSLFNDNRVASTEVSGVDKPLCDLMFDPQTAGGLLAAVDAKTAEALVFQLQSQGYIAAVIGKLIDAPRQVMLLD